MFTSRLLDLSHTHVRQPKPLAATPPPPIPADDRAWLLSAGSDRSQALQHQIRSMLRSSLPHMILVVLHLTRLGRHCAPLNGIRPPHVCFGKGTSSAPRRGRGVVHGGGGEEEAQRMVGKRKRWCVGGGEEDGGTLEESMRAVHRWRARHKVERKRVATVQRWRGGARW